MLVLKLIHVSKGATGRSSPIIWGQIHKRYISYQSLNVSRILLINNFTKIPQGQWVKDVWTSYRKYPWLNSTFMHSLGCALWLAVLVLYYNLKTQAVFMLTCNWIFDLHELKVCKHKNSFSFVFLNLFIANVNSLRRFVFTAKQSGTVMFLTLWLPNRSLRRALWFVG